LTSFAGITVIRWLLEEIVIINFLTESLKCEILLFSNTVSPVTEDGVGRRFFSCCFVLEQGDAEQFQALKTK